MTITETITVTASGQVCQRAWVTTGSPFVTSCATVTFTPASPPPAAPQAFKTCTLTSTPNVYSCLFTVVPAFPATGNDFVHVNEAPGPPMTGPGSFTTTPTVSVVAGCAEIPSPVVLTSSTSYNADIGPSGCPGTTWSVQFIETVAVTASGQICQSFWMVAAVPPTTACATVVYTQAPPPVTTSPATKVCTLTSTPNVYTCTFTFTPSFASPAGHPYLVQMVTPGPGTFTAPSVVSASTTGCGSGAALPSVTVGTLVNSSLGNADYNVTVGSAGCSATASVVITETVTVTADGQLCQTVWVTPMSPGVTACAAVTFAKSLAPDGKFAGTPNFGTSPFAFAVFNGGTVNQLETATLAAGGNGVWVQDSAGAFELLVVNGPAFVKSPFVAKFPAGFPGVVSVTLTRAQ